LNDSEIAKTQLESWIDNKTEIGLVFEFGFAVSFNEYGTLERVEKLVIFKNSSVTVSFDPNNAIPDVRFEDRCYQVRLKYPLGQISIYDPRWERPRFALGS
jgi:hypothetical protein